MIITLGPVSNPYTRGWRGLFMRRLTTPRARGAKKPHLCSDAASLPIVGREAPWGPAPIWRCCRNYANGRLLGPERPPA